MNFSKDEHIATGTELLAMDKQIMGLMLRLSNAYGVKSRERKQAEKMRNALLWVRSELENRYCREHPVDPAATHVYFGTPESRAHFGIASLPAEPTIAKTASTVVPSEL